MYCGILFAPFLPLVRPPPSWLFVEESSKTSSKTRRGAPSPKPSRDPSPETTIDERNLYKSHTVSARNPISFVHLASFAFLAVVIVSRYTILIPCPAYGAWHDCAVIQLLILPTDRTILLRRQSSTVCEGTTTLFPNLLLAPGERRTRRLRISASLSNRSPGIETARDGAPPPSSSKAGSRRVHVE